MLYADTSALVKLISAEPESEALRAFVADDDLVASELALTEVPRAITRAAAHEPRLPLDALLATAECLLEAVALLPLDRDLLLAAGRLEEPRLRALDAVHVAAALDAAPNAPFVTYDERQGAAARLAGLRTVAPGA